MFNYKKNASNYRHKSNLLLSNFLAEEIYRERNALL